MARKVSDHGLSSRTGQRGWYVYDWASDAIAAASA